jgi:paraquat-inducible protein A
VSAGDSKLVYCGTCGLLQQLPSLASAERAHCAQCSAVVGRYRPDSLNRTIAIALAALITFFVANLYPFIVVKAFGILAIDFIWSGTQALWSTGFEAVATVVFIMSMVVPLVKLLVLIMAVTAARSRHTVPGTRAIYKTYRWLADWWMADVFLLAGLVTLIRLAQLSDATPGPGLYAAGVLVVLTNAATLSFDPDLLWRDRRTKA